MKRHIQLWAVAAASMLLLAGAGLYLLAHQWIEFQALSNSSEATRQQLTGSSASDQAEAALHEQEIAQIHNWLEAAQFALPAGALDPVAAVVALADIRALAEEHAVELPTGSMGFAPKPMASPRELLQFLGDLASAGITRITAVTNSGAGSVSDTVSLSVTVVCDSATLADLLSVLQRGSPSYLVTGVGLKAAPHLRTHAAGDPSQGPMPLEVTVTADLPAPGFTTNGERSTQADGQAAIPEPLLLMEAPENRRRDQSHPPELVLLDIVPELSPWKLVASTRTASGWKVTLLNVNSKQFLTVTDADHADEVRLLSYTEKPQLALVSFAGGAEQRIAAAQLPTGRSIARLATADGEILKVTEGSQVETGGLLFTCLEVSLEQQQVTLRDDMGKIHKIPH